jgi:hypothetical protein
MFAVLKLTDIVKIFIARHFLNKERWVRNLTQGMSGHYHAGGREPAD